MKRVKVANLVPGMITAEDVFSYNGQMIIPKGLTLTDSVITRLEFYSIMSIRVEEEMGEVEERTVDLQSGASDKAPMSQIIKQSPEFKKFSETFDKEVNSFKNSMNDIVTKNAPINTDELLSNAKNLIASADGTYNTMDLLHSMRQFDDLTFAHSMNVGLICSVMGGWLKWSAEDIDKLTLCGLLHDIGKLKIPDEIIQKPDKLTDSEYDKIKTHTIEGYQILKAQSDLDPHIVNSALMHHEKNDGSGYPLGLRGEGIDPFARVVAIADVYDALTSARIYRGPMCPFKVIELFEDEGLQKYDTECILTFLRNVVNTYLHNDCMLSNGKTGTIVFCNQNALSRPIVQCGDQIIDLSKERDLHIEALI